MSPNFQRATNFSINGGSFTHIEGSQHNYNLQGSQPDMDALSRITEAVQHGNKKKHSRKASAPGVQHSSHPALESRNTLGLEDGSTSPIQSRRRLDKQPRRSSTISSDDSTPPASPCPAPQGPRRTFDAQTESRRQSSGMFSPTSTEHALDALSTPSGPPLVAPPPPPPIAAPRASIPTPGTPTTAVMQLQQNRAQAAYPTPPPPPPLPQKSVTISSVDGYTSSHSQNLSTPCPQTPPLPPPLLTPPPSRISHSDTSSPPPLPPRPYSTSTSSIDGTPVTSPHSSLPMSPPASGVPIPPSPRVHGKHWTPSLSPVSSWRRDSLQGISTQPTIPEEPNSTPWLGNSQMVQTPLSEVHPPLPQTRYPAFNDNNNQFSRQPPPAPSRASTAPSPYTYGHTHAQPQTHTHHDPYAQRLHANSPLRHESHERLWGETAPSTHHQAQAQAFHSPQAPQGPPFGQPNISTNTFAPPPPAPHAIPSPTPWVPHIASASGNGNGQGHGAPGPMPYGQQPPPGQVHPPPTAGDRRFTMPTPFLDHYYG